MLRYFRKSQGPFEFGKPDTEYARYDQIDLDVKFLIALLLTREIDSRALCVPQIDLCIDTPVVHATADKCKRAAALRVRSGILVLDVASREPRIVVPDGFDDAVRACDARFVLVNCGIYPTSDLRRGGHANAILFNTVTHAIERYEPHGFATRHVLHERVKTAFRHRFPDWKWAADEVRIGGPQDRVDAYDGMCATYTVLFVLLRVERPDASPSDIYAFIQEMTDADILDAVLRLNARIVDTLRTYGRGELTRVYGLDAARVRRVLSILEMTRFDVDIVGRRLRREISVRGQMLRTTWKSAKYMRDALHLILGE